MNNVDVVYTMWANLKKTGSMDVGQVGFHKDKEVLYFGGTTGAAFFFKKKERGL